MLQFQVETLSKARLCSLKRLSSLQHHKIIGQLLQYEVESYLSFKQFFHLEIIRFFSLGQITIIIFNTIDQLLKIQQSITLSKMTQKNIFINKKLKVMFTNLHEEDNEQLTYLQNINNLINIFYKLLISYQEQLQQQMNADNQFILSQKIKIANIYSNKIFSLLKSEKHHQYLKQFIQEQIQDQRIKDKFLDDQVMNQQQFDKIFELQKITQQQNFNKVQSEISQGGYNIYDLQNDSNFKKASILPQELYPTKQLQQPHDVRLQVSQQDQYDSLISNNNYSVEGAYFSEGNIERDEEPKQNQAIECQNQTQLVEDKLISTPTCLPPSQIIQEKNLIKDQSEIDRSGYNLYDKQNESSCMQVPIQSDLYSRQKLELMEVNKKNQQILQPQQTQISHLSDQNDDYQKEGLVISKGAIQQESSISEKLLASGFKQSGPQTSNTDAIRYFQENIQHIADESFRDNLLQILIKKYYDMKYDQAQCILEGAEFYYCFFQEFCSYMQNQNQNLKFMNVFYQNGLKKLLKLIYGKNQLLVLKQKEGMDLCQVKFHKWFKEFEQSIAKQGK